MNINIQTIAHSDHRYETVGDWWFDDEGNLQIRVSDMGNWKYEALVAFHELAEVLLCKSRGISTEDVDAFDKKFAEEGGEGEPGDSPLAPYRREHFFATNVEALLSDQLEVNFQEYEAVVESL